MYILTTRIKSADIFWSIRVLSALLKCNVVIFNANMGEIRAFNGYLLFLKSSKNIRNSIMRIWHGNWKNSNPLQVWTDSFLTFRASKHSKFYHHGATVSITEIEIRTSKLNNEMKRQSQLIYTQVYSTEANRCHRTTTYMSCSQETLFRERHWLPITQEKYPFLLTCFYIFDDDLSRFVQIVSLCQETTTFHVSFSILK